MLFYFRQTGPSPLSSLQRVCRHPCLIQSSQLWKHHPADLKAMWRGRWRRWQFSFVACVTLCAAHLSRLDLLYRPLPVNNLNPQATYFSKMKTAKLVWILKVIYKSDAFNPYLYRNSSFKNENLLKMYSSSSHPICRWVCFFIRTDLEKCSITSLAHQWILCSEWVLSEWESKHLVKSSQ